MATQGSYKRIDDGLVLHFDTANIKCFRGEPTENMFGTINGFNPLDLYTWWISNDS